MNNEIQNIRLKFNCEVDWNGMTAADGGKHCNACHKTVYDFTTTKQQEFLQILAENGNSICGRFRADQMAVAPIHIPVWQKWVSAALILVGINVLNHKTHAQGKPVAQKKHQKLTIHQQAKISESEDVVGIFVDMPQPEFPGGQENFLKFLSKNIRYNKGAIDGKVFASFLVKKDGSLADFKIVRKLNPVNDEEVLRVLKLSPKWRPAISNGKATEVVYTIPVTFQH